MLRPSLRGAEGAEAISKTDSQQAAQSQKERLLRFVPFGDFARNDVCDYLRAICENLRLR